MPPLLALTLLLALLCAAPGHARDHYVAPPGTSTETGEGQKDRPWKTLWGALNSGQVTGGDRLLLLPGRYGAVTLQTPAFDPPVRIAPAQRGTVHLESLRIDRGSGLTVAQLGIWPRQPGTRPPALVKTAGATSRIRLEHLDLRGSPNAPETYRSWALADWSESWGPNGVFLAGADSGLYASSLTATNFAVTLTGARGIARGNRIAGFSGDAIRVLGDGSRVEDNHIRDCVRINQNHDDGIQSWANRKRGGLRQPVRDLVLARNTILEWTGPDDTPLRCVLQGIGLFDGLFEGLRIENNIVSVSAYHGIAVVGGRGVEIVNNTVVHARATPGTTHPWILVRDKKDGTPSRDVLVMNNVAAGLNTHMSQDRPIMGRGKNLILRTPIRLFPRMLEGDFRTVAQPNPLLDRADPARAPTRDRFGTARPMGQGPDLGALEWE